MLGSTLSKGIALQILKTTYFLRVARIFAGKKGNKVINLLALMHQQVESWDIKIYG